MALEHRRCWEAQRAWISRTRLARRSIALTTIEPPPKHLIVERMNHALTAMITSSACNIVGSWFEPLAPCAPAGHAAHQMFKFHGGRELCAFYIYFLATFTGRRIGLTNTASRRVGR